MRHTPRSERKKRPKFKIPASVKAWPCVILAVDPGAKAGAAVYVQGALVASFQVTAGDEMRAIESAAECALFHDLPLIVVREKWQSGGPHATPAMMAGLGRAWGRWEGALMSAEARTLLREQPKVHQVYPRTWQAEVISGKVLTSEETIKRARDVALSLGAANPGPDESVACCIGLWACHAGVVGELIRLRHLERHGFDTRARRARNVAQQALAKARKAARAAGEAA